MIYDLKNKHDDISPNHLQNQCLLFIFAFFFREKLFLILKTAF